MDDLPWILVAEDDLLIKDMVEEALSDSGFELVVAATGEEAVNLMEEGRTTHRGAGYGYQTGRGTQRLGGGDASQRAQSRYQVIYMTGAAADEWPSKGVPNSHLLAKPFAPAQLVTAVSNLLNIGSPPPA